MQICKKIASQLLYVYKNAEVFSAYKESNCALPQN